MSTEQKEAWRVPYDQNPYFTGRERELTLLHHGFLMSKSSSPVSQALIGESGIGKTQIALEYAYRYGSKYQAVFWIHADSRELLATELISIADQLKLPARIGDDQEPVIAAVKEWFATQHERWLLIIDHISALDDLSVLHAFLPDEGRGNILITSNLQIVPDTIKIVVEPMEEESGTFFLLQRSLQIIHGGSLQSADSALLTEARKLVQHLGGHPLRLELAAAYLETTSDEDSSATLTLYQTFSLHSSVEAIWFLFFEYIKQQSILAADLLHFCAFLSSDIPLEIFFTPECPLALDETIDAYGFFMLAHRHGTDDETETLPYLAPLMYHPAIEALSMYFNTHRERASNTFGLHSLVQASLQHVLDEKTQHTWAERAVLAVSRIFPQEEFEAWKTCQRYLPLALVCATLIRQWKIERPEAGFLLNEAGAYLLARAQYAAAQPLLEQALIIREQVLGKEHPETAKTLHILGHLARKQARYSDARYFYERALTIREQVLERGHVDTIVNLNDLGELAAAQGDNDYARVLVQRAFLLSEQTLGPADKPMIRSLGNLATINEMQGKNEEAESGYKEALRLSESALGPNHLGTALALSRLALFYKKQGTSAQAKSLLERAIAITELKLGETHPEVARLRNHLAQLEHEERGI